MRSILTHRASEADISVDEISFGACAIVVVSVLVRRRMECTATIVRNDDH